MRAPRAHLHVAIATAPTAAQLPLPGPITKGPIQVAHTDVAHVPGPIPRLNALELADDSGRLFLIDLDKRVLLLHGATVSGCLDLAAAIGPDLKHSGGPSAGLVSISFHPDFATNGRFYTAHTEFGDAAGPDHAPVRQPFSCLQNGGPVQPARHHRLVLMEWTATEPAADVFAGTSREVLRIRAPGAFHRWTTRGSIRRSGWAMRDRGCSLW